MTCSYSSVSIFWLGTAMTNFPIGDERLEIFQDELVTAIQSGEGSKARNIAQATLDEARSLNIGNGSTVDDVMQAGADIAAGWPAPLPEDAYCGLAGAITKAIVPHTESDPAAILIQSLVAFGSLIGRGTHYFVDGAEHHGNLFVDLVGKSAKSRKGTSFKRVEELFGKVAGWPKAVNGLTSGEGIKYHVRDSKDGDAGVGDKRLLVMESEFAQCLKMGSRPGNTLSPVLRTAWDGGVLSTLTKNDPITATNPHISIIGHITEHELRSELTATDIANGLGNRFLFMCVRRSKLLPHGGETLDAITVDSIVSAIDRAAQKAKQLSRITMTPLARALWEQIYPKLNEEIPGLLGAITARGDAQCMRLALLFALMNESASIDLPHLKAAIAVWDRCYESCKYIFGDSLGDRVADDILRALKRSDGIGLTRTAISKQVFGGNRTSERIGVALELLRKRNLVLSRRERTDGAPVEVWTCR
jgi:hypothetical protein